ncbi:MAG: 16S rRNA (guanine(966)-N(2))-methyltransferase RsmD [Solobacterium sp.]|nr:16S rRNA (guanine(966)-N(2))-methyltransferase RsmD [Solobacterium sp.]
MRIVGGEYSSRRIETRKGNDTRPTLDKVREAVFSSLGGRFEGGVFLDLYAGSGANGFEALSRGMDEAVFVDSAYDAVAVIRKNAASLQCSERCTILHMKDLKALQKFREEGRKFNIVYLDPPYAKQINNRVLELLEEYELLAAGACVVIESLKEDHFEQIIGTLKPVREKEYGITRITYYKKEEQI